jgi:hypothetical protein
MAPGQAGQTGHAGQGLEAGNANHSALPFAAQKVCARFGKSLTHLAGAAGFRSLLSRALVLAKGEVPFSFDVHMAPDGVLHRPLDSAQRINTDDADADADYRRFEVSLIAQLLGLLGVFIGEALTLQLVKETWPTVCIGELPIKETAKL